jgi:hypothetical protein
VQDIMVLHEQLGQSPDEIVSAYPQLSLAKVYAALAYYHDHREDIRRDMAEDDAYVEGLTGGTLRPDAIRIFVIEPGTTS